MVKSGLVDRPHVSHFRLAAHLLLAIVILCYLFWLILELLSVEKQSVSRTWYRLLMALAALLALQLLYGAFTAGLDAGRILNTWPLMNGQVLHDAAVTITPFWLNFFENGAMIQFIHRWVGALLLIGVFVNLVFAFKRGQMIMPAVGLAIVTVVQFVLGIVTLLLHVPVVAGSLHQAVACIVVLLLVYQIYLARPTQS